MFEDTKRVIEPIVAKELLQLTQMVLDAVDEGDVETYASLVDSSMTAVEGGHIVEGVHFHKWYFDLARAVSAVPRKSTLSQPHVRLLKDVAVVTYTRLLLAGATAAACTETRVWRAVNGKWVLCHFHRSEAPSEYSP